MRQIFNTPVIMDKFTTTCPEDSMVKSFLIKKHFAYFAFKDKVYPMGSPVTLTRNGYCFCKAYRVHEGPIVLNEHYYINSSRNIHKECRLDFFPKGEKKWLSNFPADRIEEFIASVDAKPADISYQEYVNYMSNLGNNFYDNNLTPEETRAFANNIKMGIPPKCALPARFKDKSLEELDLKPMYNDFNCPGMIGSWILFIIFVFATGIFKDWYIQLILRVYGVWMFTCIRQSKLWGFG